MVWAEEALDQLISASTGISLFEVQCEFQPPLFPDQKVAMVLPGHGGSGSW